MLYFHIFYLNYAFQCWRVWQQRARLYFNRCPPAIGDLHLRLEHSFVKSPEMRPCSQTFGKEELRIRFSFDISSSCIIPTQLLLVNTLGKGSEKKNMKMYGLLPNRGGSSVLRLVWSDSDISTAINIALKLACLGQFTAIIGNYISHYKSRK